MKEGPREGTVLLVEDDPNLRLVLSDQLGQHGWQVCSESSGEAALERFPTINPDIVLLDIGLPGRDGLSVCQALRQQSGVPIILVTAADTHKIKIAALELGGDDYLTKPFYLGELLARMRAVLRRTRGAEGGKSRESGRDTRSEESVLELGSLRVDLVRREAFREGALINLTRTEFDILHVLTSRLDEAVSYKDLMDRVWGDGYNDVRSLQVHLSNLRRKIEPDLTTKRHLVTITGFGYRFRAAD